MTSRTDLSHKKLIEKLIDKKGRRKYFRELNPTLLDTPFEINTRLLKKKCKVLFIMPNFNWIDEDVNALWDLLPWNLCVLASMIEDIVSEVKIIDAYKDNLSKEELTKKIIKYKPDIVGITVLMDQYSKVAPITAKIIKDISQKIITVLGGVYATTNSKIAIKDKNLDYVVIGEGEFVFRQLVGFYSGACDLPDKGICFKTKGNGKIDYRGHAPFIKNLDLLPKPAYHLIDFLGYAKRWGRKSIDRPAGYPYTRIVTSRGCPEKCSFCQVPAIQGSYFRARSPDHVCDEIEWLKKEYGIKSFIFDDDSFFTNTKRAKALLSKIIERNLSMPWTALQAGVFRLDEEMINLLVESGCNYMGTSIESGTERITNDVILKPINFDHAKKMIAYAKKKGIFVSSNFIIGFPTESWQEIRQTIAFAEDLNADYTRIHIAIPLQHTEMFDLARETGSLITTKKDFESKWTVGGVMKSDDWTADDLTILRAYEWDKINFTDPIKSKRIADRMGISVDELHNDRKRTLDYAIKSISARH